MLKCISRPALSLLALAAATSLAGPSRAQERRPLRVDDIFELKTAGDPRISPDGQWVAYTVSRLDAGRDRSDTDIYMVPMTGGSPVRLTTSDKPERAPRWSPDGRYLAFLSGREGDHTQVWLLDRRGGEATRLTDYNAAVSWLAWSPDSTRLALVVRDVDPDDAEKAASKDDEEEERPKPMVITRLQFKRDGEGYLTDLRQHVHVFDLRDKSSAQITSGPYDDETPVWSPDGRWIAFVSNRTEEPDSNDNRDIFLVAPQAGAAPKPLTTLPSDERAPAFTPDGRLVVYLAGGDPKDIWYGIDEVAVVSIGVDGSASGAPRRLTSGLDRNASSPLVAPDGSAALFLLEDAGNSHLARVPLGGGPVERVVSGERDISAFDAGSGGALVVLESQPHQPFEISRANGGALARLTHTNDELLSKIALGPVERFKATSTDGTVVEAFLTRPPNAPGGPLPTILRIHGGPVSQYSTRFNLEWQLLAAHGYAVVGANPRGSSGYGHAFSRAIWADWGNTDYEDVMAAVDRAIAMGVADPDRLGVGGWSYGGILTNYVITKTTRFKAAISGSSEVNYTANYGHDHYQHEWEAELGLPWRNLDRWLTLSPFFQVERITTPTLVLCGDKDWNVPLLNSEQLYQALRRLGRDTMLIIYPGESHSIRRPSFQKDRYQRYLAWYEKYLRSQTTSAGG